MRLGYNKYKLDFTCFQVWYTYRRASNDLLKSWVDKRVTGVELKWMIENPTLQVTVTNVSGSVQTPEFGSRRPNSHHLKRQITYKAILKFPENILDILGNGSMVIEIDYTAIREAEHLMYREGAGYELMDVNVPWNDANHVCKKRGSLLASVLNIMEQNEVTQLITKTDWTDYSTSFWIGGSRGNDRKLRWTDGKYVMYTFWDNDYDHGNCISLYRGRWRLELCDTFYLPCVCRKDAKRLQGNNSRILEYTKENLTFNYLHVEYQFQPLMNVSKEDSGAISGFSLKWYLRDENGIHKGADTAQDSNHWRALLSEPRFENDVLNNLVQIAKQGRLENKTKGELIEKTILEKERMITAGIVNYGECVGGQVTAPNFEKILDNFDIGIERDNYTAAENFSMEDIETGFSMLSVLSSCPVHIIRLNQFLTKLINSKSPGNILQATVKTIQSPEHNFESRRFLRRFYLSLEEIFDLKLGKILLAISGPRQINKLRSQDLPFLDSYKSQINRCRRVHNCTKLRQLIDSLGKGGTKKMDFYHDFCN